MLVPKNEKEHKERRKNALVIAMSYLLDQGYTDALTKLEAEAGVDLSEFELGDNVDLLTIIKDWEDFYNYKYDKRPVIIRKRTEPQPKRQTAVKKPATLPAIQKPLSQSKENVENNAQKVQNGANLLSVQGKSATPQPTSANTQNIADWDSKPVYSLPDSIRDNDELRALAKGIQRDIITRNPCVTFEQIVGLEDVKTIVKEAVLFPLKFADFFDKGLIDTWSGVLFFGPPGTGKTHLAKAVATECGTTFFNISASSIISKYHGESEKMVRILFELARHNAPSTIFLDEIDAIMTRRSSDFGQHEASRRLKTELLIQMDGLLSAGSVGQKVFVIAASNTPWDLDEAFLRRLEKRVNSQGLFPVAKRHTKNTLIEAFLRQIQS